MSLSITIFRASPNVNVSLFCNIPWEFKFLTPVRKVLFHLRHPKDYTLQDFR